ncbi:MAG: hypothetical protein HON76_08595 [Candidatus Scalindua sp.]|nr:hypothetical protein [Candidatus Scalindua sp.]MBT6562572.1 hypothetical protein [Candidatus Scalindua sp.]
MNITALILWFLHFVHFPDAHVCTTFSGIIMVIQRRSVGHVLSWHGEHSTSSRITLPDSYSDSVYLGSLGLISTTTGQLGLPLNKSVVPGKSLSRPELCRPVRCPRT